MPPRFAYWTILIDAKPTAFRARDREELLPTLRQLGRTNSNVELRWFANGRLWDTPEQAQWARRNVPKPDASGRGPDWRPGGTHKDPRARFARKRKPQAGQGTRGSGRPSAGAGPKRERPPRADRRPPRKPRT